MKRILFFFLLYLFISSLGYSQSTTGEVGEVDGIESGDPNIYYLTPANGAVITTAETSTWVTINFAINNLESCWWRGNFLGFEVWVNVDGTNRFYYRDNPPRHPVGNWYGLSYSNSIQVYLPRGSHNVNVFAKNFEVKFDLYLDIDDASRTNYFSIVAPPPPPPPLNATMSGPSTLYPGQSGTYVTNATGGNPPYTYTWSYYVYCPGGGGIGYDEKPINNGNLNTDDVPCGYWVNIYNTTNTVTKAEPGGRDFTMKCVVKDASNSTKTVTKYVSVITSLAKNVKNTNPKDLELSLGSYPNPFNPSTKINVVIPNSGMVTLKIYDILGRVVAVLANEVKEFGEYEFDFNANNLPSGTYIAALTTNNGTMTQKLLLVK